MHDRKLGVFSLVRKTNRPFTADDVEMADMVAQQVAIALSNAIAYKEIADLKDRLAKEKVYLEDEIRSELNFSEIVGKSAALRNVLKQIETVAPTDSTVLLEALQPVEMDAMIQAAADHGHASEAERAHWQQCVERASL